MNSFYSFWWDVTYDWGLTFLKKRPQTVRSSGPPRPLILPTLQPKRSSSIENGSSLHARASARENGGKEASASHPSGQRERWHPWGLRPTTLYPIPVYPLVVFMNLLLRLTWSFKLSAHLHARFAAPILAGSSGSRAAGMTMETTSDAGSGIHMSGALLFFWLELAEICGSVDGVEQRCIWAFGHHVALLRSPAHRQWSPAIGRGRRTAHEPGMSKR